MTFTITLTQEQIAKLDKIMATRSHRTKLDVMNQIVDRGLYALDYRTERNRKVYASQASLREEIKQLKASLMQK